MKLQCHLQAIHNLQPGRFFLPQAEEIFQTDFCASRLKATAHPAPHRSENKSGKANRQAGFPNNGAA